MSSGQWVVVSVAVLLAGGTLGGLLTLQRWSSARRRRPVAVLLGLHAGIVGVIGIVAVAAAAHSWQLLGHAAPAHGALLDVSHTDGDGSMYALLVLVLAFGTVLAVVALSLGARFASGDDPTERIVACGVLGLEICVAGYSAAQLLGGRHGTATIALAVHLPLLIVAMVVCWPPLDPAELA